MILTGVKACTLVSDPRVKIISLALQTIFHNWDLALSSWNMKMPLMSKNRYDEKHAHSLYLYSQLTYKTHKTAPTGLYGRFYA